MNPPRVRIICLGDSLTVGIANSELNRWPVLLALALERQSPGGYEVFTRAKNGATTFDALQWAEGEIGYLLPGIVLVALGVNDALVRPGRRWAQVGLEGYRANLLEIAEMVEARGGRLVFVVEHEPTSDTRPEPRRFYVPGNGRGYWENYAPYRAMLQELAVNLKASLIDLPALLRAEKLDSSALVMADGLHLTDEGNAIYAQLILGRLVEILPLLVPQIERKPVQHG